MEIVKKNILSIICGVVALIALIALEWPLKGMYDETQSELDKRQSVDTELTKLVKIPRAWPVIPELETGAQTPLKRFPNEDVIAAGTVIKNAVHKQAAEMKGTTAAQNEHALLVPGVLPNPRDLRFGFQKAYIEAVQKTNSDNSDRLRTQLKGTLPPTDQDVLDAAKKLYLTEYQGKILNVGGKNVNEEQIVTDWRKACSTLEATMRLQTAQKAMVYIEPEWLPIQAEMLNSAAGPKEVDIWYAQNMLWVQQDLVDAIARINGSAHNITDAPIKHIFRIDVPGDASQYVMNTASGATPNAPETEAPGKAFGVSPTGRVCNPLYDVIQFSLVMNVEARLLPAILAELQRGKLITVEQFDLSAVDGIAAANEGYVYGNVPVVKLAIRGEELFLRDWTVPLMPSQIKELLQVPVVAPAQAQ